MLRTGPQPQINSANLYHNLQAYSDLRTPFLSLMLESAPFLTRHFTV